MLFMIFYLRTSHFLDLSPKKFLPVKVDYNFVAIIVAENLIKFNGV